MDELPTSQAPQQTQNPQPHPLSFLQGIEWTTGGIILGLGFLAIMLIILNYFNILSLSTSYPNQLGWLPHQSVVLQPSPTPIQQTSLSDPTSILKSPVFTEWLGSVEGKLIRKDTQSFTLEKNGATLTIYLQDKLTLFFRQATDSAQVKKLTLENIPIGSYLRGGVTISRGSLTGKTEQHIIGNGFTLVPNPPEK